MKITVNVGAAFKGAPLGILGAFIENKLAQYVEPSRAGTPKGEPVGLSRKKFHAALLALTNVDLHKQAKIIRVGYGLLRKWRTEESFGEKVLELEGEFVEQRYAPQCKDALTILIGLRGNLVDISAGENVKESELGKGLPGFDDIGLYGLPLVVQIHDKMKHAIGKAAQENGWIEAALSLSVPLARFYRTMKTPKATSIRINHAKRLNALHSWARVEYYEKDKDECIYTMSLISAVIDELLTD